MPPCGDGLSVKVKAGDSLFEEEHLGGDVSIYGISVAELADPCALDSVNDKSATDDFSGFVQLEIMPQIFVDSVGARADNRSDVAGYDQVDGGLFGRGKNLVV